MLARLQKIVHGLIGGKVRNKLFVRIVIALVTTIAICGLFVWAIGDAQFAVLEPKGEIARQQRNLLYFTVGLSLVVVIPVFAMLWFFAWRYRADNTRAVYTPNWSNNHIAEFIWWGVPILLITILATVTWRSTHSLDPYRQLDSDKKPLQVQVISLQWRWLFIYPDENVASINQLYLPTDRPIEFTITSDAPMNSFWIPNLGGQVYAMSGMSTKLHLIANQAGNYRGLSANISGSGFSDMEFRAIAVDQTKFDTWLTQTRSTANPLSWSQYTALAKPANDHRSYQYSPVEVGLYDKVIMKYMSNMEEHAH